MLDCSFLINSVHTKKVVTAELFQSTGRATGGQWFVKLHFDPPGFPTLVLGDIGLKLAWIQLGHPLFLTSDGKAFEPKEPIPATPSWLEGLWIDLRLEQKEFYTKWRGEKTYLAPRFLKINLDRKD